MEQSKKDKIAKVMTEFYDGRLKDSHGKKVKNPKQAKAIAMSEAGVSKKKKGGNIPNNYVGKSANQVWDKWTQGQRVHFLKDHGIYDNPVRFIGDKSLIQVRKSNYGDLPENLKMGINNHVSEGQYGKGGNIEAIDAEIAEFKELLEAEGVPEDEKQFAREEIVELEAKKAKVMSEAASVKTEKTAAPKKEKAPSPKPAVKVPAYDCDELIKNEKDKAVKRKTAAAERAKQPEKTPATKNKEVIEHAAEKVGANISKRIEKGDVSKVEIEKLIKETKELLNTLEQALRKIK